jgi:hypothetical protein
MRFETLKSSLAERKDSFKPQILTYNEEERHENENLRIHNSIIIEEQRKLSGALLIAPDGNIVKVGRSIHWNEKSKLYLLKSLKLPKLISLAHTLYKRF